MWKAVAVSMVLGSLPAYGQTITVFGNSDAQQCYMYTKLPGGSGGLAYCTKALNIEMLSSADKAATLVNRGILYNHMRRFSEAEADFVAALEINKDLGEAYINWGNTKIFLKDFVTAKKYYDQAITIGVDEMHAAYYDRGLANEALKDLQAAFQDFVDAEKYRPQWSLALERIEKYEANGFKRMN